MSNLTKERKIRRRDIAGLYAQLPSFKCGNLAIESLYVGSLEQVERYAHYLVLLKPGTSEVWKNISELTPEAVKFFTLAEPSGNDKLYYRKVLGVESDVCFADLNNFQ